MKQSSAGHYGSENDQQVKHGPLILNAYDRVMNFPENRIER